MKLIQASALLAAIALTVTVPPALADYQPTCVDIQKRAAQMTMEQVRSRMERMKIPQEWRTYVETCLKDKK